MDPRIGQSARVTLTIKADGGEGEVIVRDAAYPARASDSASEFKTGKLVYVEDVSGRTCYVSSGRDES